MKEFEHKPLLVHLIIGYGNARFDMGTFNERGDEFLYARAKNEANEFLEHIQDKLKQPQEPNDVSP